MLYIYILKVFSYAIVVFIYRWFPIACISCLYKGPVDTTNPTEEPSSATRTQHPPNATDNAAYDDCEPITFEAIRVPFSALSKISKKGATMKSAANNDGNNSSAVDMTALHRSGYDGIAQKWKWRTGWWTRSSCDVLKNDLMKQIFAQHTKMWHVNQYCLISLCFKRLL